MKIRKTQASSQAHSLHARRVHANAAHLERLGLTLTCASSVSASNTDTVTASQNKCAGTNIMTVCPTGVSGCVKGPHSVSSPQIRAASACFENTGTLTHTPYTGQKGPSPNPMTPYRAGSVYESKGCARIEIAVFGHLSSLCIYILSVLSIFLLETVTSAT